jgi:hypothetical protein
MPPPPEKESSPTEIDRVLSIIESLLESATIDPDRLIDVMVTERQDKSRRFIHHIEETSGTRITVTPGRGRAGGFGWRDRAKTLKAALEAFKTPTLEDLGEVLYALLRSYSRPDRDQEGQGVTRVRASSFEWTIMYRSTKASDNEVNRKEKTLYYEKS